MPKLSEYFLFPSNFCSSVAITGKLKGKTVLITGASFGIGAEIVTQLATSGATLILVARTLKKLEELQHFVSEKGGKALVFSVDLYEQTAVDEFIEQLKVLTISVDIFINNAGKSIQRSIFDSLDRFHDLTRTNAINFLSPAKLTLFLIPFLVKNNGQIINVSAINVLFIPAPKWSAYQASKTAFDQWLRSLAPELRAQNITVSFLYLPLVRTRMIAPTKAYDTMPAMSVNQVATIVLKMILKKRTFLNLGGFSFRKFLQFCLGLLESGFLP